MKSNELATMRSLTFWLLGFVCGFFIGGMVEDAQAFTPASNPYIERYERIAISYWGDVPDAETIEYLFPATDPWVLSEDDPSTPEDDTEPAVARAFRNGSQVWLIYWPKLEGNKLDRRDIFAGNCGTFVHEWGHLLGFNHDHVGYSYKLYYHCDAAAAARYPNAMPPLKGAPPKLKPDPAPRPKRTQRGGAVWAQDFEDSGPARDTVRSR